MIENVEGKSKKYLRQSLRLTSLLFIIAMAIDCLADMTPFLTHPAMVGAVFNIVIALSISIIWRLIAQNNESMLTTFYMATNGFRMLLALAALTICYFIVGTGEMTRYVLVFMVFYLAADGHHAIYFSRITKQNK